MKVNIIKTEGYALLAEIEIDGERYGVMDDFSMVPKDKIDFDNPEISYLDGFDWNWDQMFQGNPNKEKKLVRTGDWSYDAFGQIISINPTIADFGIFRLEIGEITNDERCIGEWILEKIERLDLTFRSK